MPESPAKLVPNFKGNAISSKMETPTIHEDVKEDEVEDEEGLTLYPYERLTTSSNDPASDIDVFKREVAFFVDMNELIPVCFISIG